MDKLIDLIDLSFGVSNAKLQLTENCATCKVCHGRVLTASSKKP